MSLDPFAGIKARIRDSKNPNSKLDQLKYAAAQARLPFDRDVWLNIAFYSDQQYVEWNPKTLALQEIPRPEGSTNVPRPVANKMMHFAAQSHASALQDKPTVDVMPAGDEPQDLGNTSVSQAYLNSIADPSVADFDSKLSAAVLWAIVGGEGYLKWTYSPKLKRPDICAPSPLDLYVDPYATSFSAARYIIHSQFMDVEQVYDLWGRDVQPSETSTVDEQRASLLRQMGAAPALSGVTVNELWMKPSRRFPDGLYAVWTGRDQIVAPTRFPYNHQQLPFTQLGVIPYPQGMHYASALKFMRSGQMELNKYHAQRIMTRELMANAKWWIPSELQLQEDPDDSPGQILRGDSMNGQLKPELIQGTGMADNGDGDWISQELMDIIGLHEVSTGQVPGRVEAAKAIDMLKQSDVDRLSVLNSTIKTAITRGFWQILQLARQYVPDGAIVQTYSAEGLPEVRRWRREAVKPGTRVRVTMGTGLARTRSAREDQLLNYWQNGIITDPDRMAQLLDMPSPSFNESNVFDMRLARNENLDLAEGRAIVPNSWDNHEIHLREHNNYRKTHDYLLLPQEAKNKFEFHCTTHEQLWPKEMAKVLERAQFAQQLMAAQGGGQGSQGSTQDGGTGSQPEYGPEGPRPGWQAQGAAA